jgi:predicted transcriptional regulator
VSLRRQFLSTHFAEPCRPVSIGEAARRVKRDVKAVHSDIAALLNAGVLDRAPGGGVVFPYDAVKVEFLFRAR